MAVDAALHVKLEPRLGQFPDGEKGWCLTLLVAIGLRSARLYNFSYQVTALSRIGEDLEHDLFAGTLPEE
ncbi:hypothetical protein [Pseudonocardia sp. TRM90224]|uniref:hypothetical protein n=1 Tax=Pseudonocardia sp. TRM90224 TaxID=2812678 RepID=UPI001E301D8C|nr:hypothetical protein [Pseudonocardia sp. TRM90224]